MRIRSLVLLPLILLAGCSRAPAPVPSKPAVGPPTGSEAVNQMIAVHGGMEAWRSAPALSFEDSFSPAAGGSARVSRVTVEMNTRRAYLEFPQTNALIVWDGENAWSVNWKEKTPPRFMALLSFYFVGLPWLTTDPGVNFSPPATGRLPGDPTEYITVKMTFDAGVGDTPDDYYLLYIDPETHLLKATEFTVTYAALLPPDVEAIKEYGVYERYSTVEGLKVPAKFTIYGGEGKPLGTYEWRNISFSQPFDETRMQMPKNAVIDTSNPARVAPGSN